MLVFGFRNIMSIIDLNQKKEQTKVRGSMAIYSEGGVIQPLS